MWGADVGWSAGDIVFARLLLYSVQNWDDIP